MLKLMGKKIFTVSRLKMIFYLNLWCSILGLLYDHGHLSRAVCCRVGRGDTDIDTMLPEGYRLNHPWLGRVTVCDPPREVQVPQV